MFNGKYKKEALELLKRANDTYQETYNQAVNDITQLHETRIKTAVPLLKGVETYILSLRNRPKEYDKTVREIVIRREKFEHELHKLELEGQKVDQVSGSLVGAGVVAGAGVAALGPSAAMAVAMTFGTASTGTAIATLSGAAATNAALAWLGGGALAAGGAGMIGGEAFLALMGPVGWAIGGAALVSGGALASKKNKEIAQKAEKSTREIKKVTEDITEKDIKVVAIHRTTKHLVEKMKPLLQHLDRCSHDYTKLSHNDKNKLILLLNAAESLSKEIGAVVS